MELRHRQWQTWHAWVWPTDLQADSSWQNGGGSSQLWFWKWLWNDRRFCVWHIVQRPSDYECFICYGRNLWWQADRQTGAVKFSSAMRLAVVLVVLAASVCSPQRTSPTQSCSGRKVLNGDEGFISDGPENYLANSHCEWLIDGEYLRLTNFGMITLVFLERQLLGCLSTKCRRRGEGRERVVLR